MKKENLTPFELIFNKEEQAPVYEIQDWEGMLRLAGLTLYNCTPLQKDEVINALCRHFAIVFGGNSVNTAKVAGIVAVKRFKEEYPDQYIDKLEDWCHEGGYMAYVTITDQFVEEYQNASDNKRQVMMSEAESDLPTMLYDAKVDLMNGGELYSDDECNHLLNGANYGIRLRLENVSTKDMLKELFPFLTDLNFTGGYFE